MKKVLRLFTVSLFLLCSFKQAKAQDTITFEVPSTDIFINPDSGNLWQIGKPHKVFFSSAHHGSKAIITDTLNTYPPNDTSSFIYTIHKPLIKTCVTCMSFSQKYDLDTLGDKGII